MEWLVKCPLSRPSSGGDPGGNLLSEGRGRGWPSIPLPSKPSLFSLRCLELLLDELVKGSATCLFLIFKMRSNTEDSPEN